MNKALLIILVLILIGAGAFYFLYLAPPSEEPAALDTQIKRVDTNFNLAILDKLDDFLVHGTFPITIKPTSLRKSSPKKAEDPFFN
jgi:ABC-type anion transport system duplicated permease subunit